MHPLLERPDFLQPRFDRVHSGILIQAAMSLRAFVEDIQGFCNLRSGSYDQQGQQDRRSEEPLKAL